MVLGPREGKHVTKIEGARRGPKPNERARAAVRKAIARKKGASREDLVQRSGVTLRTVYRILHEIEREPGAKLARDARGIWRLTGACK